MGKPEIQVAAEHYFQGYDHQERWRNYWHQIEVVHHYRPETILEIGVGNKTVSNYLKAQKYDLETLDFDPELKPDHTGDLRSVRLPATYEMVMCCEVLEHLPLKDFSVALENLGRLTEQYLLISLPQRVLPFHFRLKLPKLPALEFFFCLPRLPRVRFEFDGEHYWELEVRGATSKKILSMVREAGFRVLLNKTHADDWKHRFILLEKVK